MIKKSLLTAIAFACAISSSMSFAQECDPGFQPDAEMNTPGFDPSAFAKKNKVTNSVGSTQFCFLGSSASGMSPTKVFNDVCGCKEEIKKNCSIGKKGRIIGHNGVPSAWCVPFAPFL